MTADDIAESANQHHWSLIFCVFFPVLALALLGQDSNWDLQNYHLYNPHAWLTGRGLLDVAPAQLQTWHNPLLDVPFYLMASHGWHGSVISLWLTLPSMFACYFSLQIYQCLRATPASATQLFLLALLISAGASARAVLGTTFNDAFVAAGILGALWLIVRSEQTVRLRGNFFAGVIAGGIAGLKLTALLYCVGLAAAELTRWQNIRRFGYGIILLSLGGMLGFLLSYGYWGDVLFVEHGNPFFPYFNHIFRSQDALFLPYADVRFRPSSWLDALLVPMHLLSDSRLFSESRLRDPRIFLGLLSFIVVLWRSRHSSAQQRRDGLCKLALFFIVSLLLWTTQFGIYRYALPLEMIACVALFLACDELPRYRVGVLLVLTMAVIGATNAPNWGRGEFTQPMLDVNLPHVPNDALIVIASDEPLAFVASKLPVAVPIISIKNNFMQPTRCTRLQARAEKKILTHPGPLWLLAPENGPAGAGQHAEALLQYGLTVASACQPVTSTLANAQLCPLTRRAFRPICTAQLKLITQ